MDVESVARKFRAVIEGQVLSDDFQGEVHDDLKKFPNAACEISSVLLGNYLKNKECSVNAVNGRRLFNNVWRFHTWLECDGVFLDITADQFPDCEDKIIFSNEHPLHSTFSIDSISELSIRGGKKFRETVYSLMDESV